MSGHGTARGVARIREAAGRVEGVVSAADRNLALRAAKGDVGAFSALVQEHSALVYRVSLRVLGASDAPDASQEVWVRVWRNIKNFRGESAFTTWLYRITMNTCLSMRQRETRREERG